MESLVQFILDNMERESTQEIQAEFNILYEQYDKAIDAAKYGGINEDTMLSLEPKIGIEVPEDKMDMFEEWFDARVDSMMRTEVRLTKELN